tara:strand:- start:6066 stop:6269 length:204 start_codon:yes stop_codon:yes gene_type:complete
LFGSEKYIVKRLVMEFIITVLVNIAGFMLVASFFNVLFSKETWCGDDDYEMSAEEQEAFHYEFFHRR